MIGRIWATAAAAALAAAAAQPASAAAPRDERVYQAVEAARPWALDLLKEIVNIDSGTGDVEGGRKVTALLAERLSALGAAVRMEPAEAPGLPDNLVAVLRGTGRGRVLVVAHIDTVFGPGTAAKRPFSIDGDRGHGPGVGDEKAGVVEAVTALKILNEIGFKDFASITLLLDDSEELGSPGSTRLIRRLAAASDVELNMEPGDIPDALTVWRKGSASIVIKVKGRAAHAGVDPQDGRNAALELLHQLQLIEPAAPHSGPGPTLNLTLIKGGDRDNIIPAEAEATLNARFRRREELDAMLARAEANARTVRIPDTVVTVEHQVSFPPLVDDAAVEGLAARAKAIYAEIGRTPGLSGNGGASESAVAQSVGTPALDGLGPAGGDFHTDHEWIDLRTVSPRLYLFTRLLMEVGSLPPRKR